MTDLLQRTKKSLTIMAIITIILGFVLTFWPVASVKVICIILGWALLIGGITWIIVRFSSAPSTNASLILGVIITAFGLWMVIHPSIVVQFIAVIFGILVLVHGFMMIQDSLELKQNGYNQWAVFLLLGVTLAALGIFVIWSPIVSSKVMTIIIGISLILDGISNLVFVIKASNRIKSLRY